VIVCENGQSGFNAEHSCMDGTPVSRMNDWILDALANKKIDLGSSSDSNLPAPTPIEFVLSDTTKQNILRSVTKFHNLMSLQTLDVLEYPGYGKRVIKNQFKTSPDAIAQLTFQLGHYKLFGRVPVTYESCQTRKFKLGRTEVIRSCSIEALEWCKAMEDVNADWPTRLEKFKLAAKAHLAYAKEASDGQGVDRHLLGEKIDFTSDDTCPNPN
jgi:carnitine O-acetyltransferase